MRNIFFIIGMLVLVLSSCRAHRQVVQQITSDSTSITFKEVEKVIHIPGDSVKVNMQIQLDRTSPGSGTTPVFVPQSQTIETKRSKVHVNITESGQLTAEAVCKEWEEKYMALEKTYSSYKKEATEYGQKQSGLFKELNDLITKVVFGFGLLGLIVTAFKLGLNPISILKKLFKKP